MRTLLLGLLIKAALFSGCGNERNDEPTRDLMYGSPTDVEAFLAQAQVSVQLTDCENIRYSRDSITRGLSCLTHLSSDDQARLHRHFSLESDQVQAEDNQAGECGDRPQFTGSAIVRLGARWGCGPPNRGFGYLYLYIDPVSRAACVQTEYNWSC